MAGGEATGEAVVEGVAVVVEADELGVDVARFELVDDGGERSSIDRARGPTARDVVVVTWG